MYIKPVAILATPYKNEANLNHNLVFLDKFGASVELDRMTEVKPTKREHQPPNDEELAQLVAGGDAAALELLYDRYSRQAIGLAYRIIGQLELAEEVVQEAFLRFWERPDLYQVERGRFVSWLLTVVHHRAINERRRSGFRLNVSADQPAGDGSHDLGEAGLLSQLSHNGPGPHEVVWKQEQRAAVRQALDQLSHPQRQVIELTYFNGLNQREVAQHLGEPLGTIKTRVRLAMQKLRKLLEAHHSDTEFISEAELA